MSQGAIAAYNLKKSVIPTRRKEHIPVDAWNGSSASSFHVAFAHLFSTPLTGKPRGDAV